MQKIISHFLILSLFFSCAKEPASQSIAHEEEKKNVILTSMLNDTLINLTDLKRGDLLVKPNHNWFPGTSWVKGGISFGHVAIVVEGASGNSSGEVLKKAVILESQARDVPEEFQLRKVNACKPGFDYRFDNYSFDQSKSPYRYRLRAGLSESQIDSVIVFMENHEKGISCWRAQKVFDPAYFPRNGQKSYWYCSYYVWQAFYTVLRIDLDVNKGLIIYPNDVIWCPLFDNDSVNKTKRVRF